jgi:hypothetical protein
MLGSNRVYLALALVTTAAVVAAAASGCGGGDTVSTTSTSSGTGGSGGGGGGTSTSTASSSSDASSSSTGGLTCTAGEGVVLAVRKLTFGEGTNGQWKKVGVNLDGLDSTAASSDTCKLNDGAFSVTPYPDGENGIDNSFGKNLLPQMIALYPTLVADTNNGITNGVFTAMLKLDCVTPTGDIPSFTTKLFGGTALGSKPKFDGTDKWPVAPELLSDPMDPQSSNIIFPSSSIVGDAYEGGKNETFILTVPLNTATTSSSIKLTVYAAHTTMTLSADRKSAIGGKIGGVLNTEEFVAEIKKVGALLALCDNPIFPGLLTTIRQASDIMADGTQDTTKVCDGISIGLGFEMKEVLIGDVGKATPIGASCP